MITNVAASPASPYNNFSSANTFANVLRNPNINESSATGIGPIANSLINKFKAQLQFYHSNTFDSAVIFAAAQALANKHNADPQWRKTTGAYWYSHFCTPDGESLKKEAVAAFWKLPKKERDPLIQWGYNQLTADSRTSGPFIKGRDAFNGTLGALANAPLWVRQEVKKWYPQIVALAYEELYFIDGDDPVHSALLNNFLSTTKN
ncbi:MAG: hypothetical protein JWM36_1147 [Hyphomicrobiales bacterium]|nr:hypothetical protein [Hyphomicrobiales bacterium]